MSKTKGFAAVICGCISIVYLTYFGFCHGWWLQNNMWVHYAWLCHCGIEFEQSLYPKGTKIVVSACRYSAYRDLSPDGRYLVVDSWEKQSQDKFVVDLMTQQERAWSYSAKVGRFWTDNLFLVNKDRRTWQLVDVTTGKEVNLTIFEISRQKPMVILPEAIQAFQQADKILTLSEDEAPFLALASQPEQKSAMNYLLAYPSDGYGKPKEPVEAILAQHHITYTQITLCNSAELAGCFSHNSQLIGRDKDIYNLEGRQLTQDWGERPGLFMESMYFIGWAQDDSGIYVAIAHDYVLGSRFPGMIDVLPNLPLPGSTIVKVNVPEQYR